MFSILCSARLRRRRDNGSNIFRRLISLNSLAKPTRSALIALLLRLFTFKPSNSIHIEFCRLYAKAWHLLSFILDHYVLVIELRGGLRVVFRTSFDRNIRILLVLKTRIINL